MNQVFKNRTSIWLTRLKKFQNSTIKNCTTCGTLVPKKVKKNILIGPGLREFLVVGKNLPVIQTDEIPYLEPKSYSGSGRKVFFEVYGCQMNVNDSEVVWAILKKNDFQKCDDIGEADVILLITCAIREGAETKIWNRLKHLHALKRNRPSKKGYLQIGVLGCMAERLKIQLLEKEQWVDVIAGPDSYKDLPRLLAVTQGKASAINVLLSLDETYADVMPVRLNKDAVTAFISIMRGCDNMCTYCIVPFTRGRERSRPIHSIENEVRRLVKESVREITLLGQNVNSYRDVSVATSRDKETGLSPGFKTVYKPKIGGIRFAELLERVAEIAPDVRFRFTSPHPKDFPEDVLCVIAKYPNICKSLHLPAQSGSSTVLERMRRGYSRETYIELVNNIRKIIPNVSLSSDFICGFCGETESEFQETISLIKQVKFNVAYLFAYSMREKTAAHRRYKDDIPQEIKIHRLQEMVKTYREVAAELQRSFVGNKEVVLVEGTSKRSEIFFFGRNDANIKVIIPKTHIPTAFNSNSYAEIEPGHYVVVSINSSSSQVLTGTPLFRTTLSDYYLQTNEKKK